MILIVFILIFLIGCYGFIDKLSVFNSIQNKSTLKYKPQTGDVLKPKIKDNIAWITMDDTKLDYPIMQGTDNNTYLNKNVWGNYALSGSIFLDCRNSFDFSDDFNLVYGHNMEHGLMFGCLDEWLDKDYFDNHRTGTLTTGNSIYRLEVYAIVNTDTSEEEIFIPDAYTFDESLTALERNAVYIADMDRPDHVVAMSTCKDSITNARTVLVCQMTLIYQGE